MCKENLSLTKKMAKSYLKSINKTYNGLDKCLEPLSNFLLLDDSFKKQKLEWILGVPQIKNRKSWNTEKYQFGVEMVERINDEAYTYMSNLVTNTSDEAFL